MKGVGNCSIKSALTESNVCEKWTNITMWWYIVIHEQSNAFMTSLPSKLYITHVFEKFDIPTESINKNGYKILATTFYDNWNNGIK